MTDLHRRIRALFLTEDNVYGCAETTLVALQEHFGLTDADDSSPAMALNGGIAYSGGTCGAIIGAAMAIGRLAGHRINDHREAKAEARRLVQGLMKEFGDEFGALDCRTLTGYDMRTEHAAFLESGIWRETCLRQIQFAAAWTAPLAGPWETEPAGEEGGTSPLPS